MLIRKKIKHAGWMWLDPDDHGVGQRLNAQGYREPGFMWMLRTEARGVALDIGANIGYCTLTMAKKCSLIVAVEPDPRTYLTLSKNVAHLPNVKPVALAVGDRRGTVRFDRAERPNLSRVTETGGTAVEMGTLDEAYGPNVMDFVKMDIEGGEVGVIKGGRQFFGECNRLKLAMELHPERYSRDNDMAAELDWLLQKGYRFKYVENAKDKIAEFTTCGCRPCRTFPHTSRAIFKAGGLPPEHVLIRMCTEMPEDGKKVVRSILLVKE